MYIYIHMHAHAHMCGSTNLDTECDVSVSTEAFTFFAGTMVEPTTLGNFNAALYSI